jgi:hypothetical protein
LEGHEPIYAVEIDQSVLVVGYGYDKARNVSVLDQKLVLALIHIVDDRVLSGIVLEGQEYIARTIAG